MKINNFQALNTWVEDRPVVYLRIWFAILLASSVTAFSLVTLLPEFYKVDATVLWFVVWMVSVGWVQVWCYRSHRQMIDQLLDLSERKQFEKLNDLIGRGWPYDDVIVSFVIRHGWGNHICTAWERLHRRGGMSIEDFAQRILFYRGNDPIVETVAMLSTDLARAMRLVNDRPGMKLSGVSL